MAKVDYGAVALIPVGDYSASRQYHANELVGYQGSSYIALQNPPVGTLPTNTTYFMLHTEGTSIATPSTPGTVKPDGTSTVVDGTGTMSVKPSLVQAIQDTAEAASKIGNVPAGKTLQSQLNAATRSIAQNTTDIAKVTLSYIQSTRVPMENLGTAVTAEQLSYIKNGEGYQLGLGSYWDDQAQGIVWRIWDFDKFYNTGDVALKTRNACVLPDANLIHADGSAHYMNDTDTTAGGYNATKYRSTYRPQCRTKFANFFGSTHIITYRELLSNVVSSGAASGWSWYDCDVELPTEEMIYGHGVWGTSTIVGQGGYNVGNSWGRLALSLLKPEFVCNRENYWLRNVVSASDFAVVNDNCHAGYFPASDPAVGFRPFALIS